MENISTGIFGAFAGVAVSIFLQPLQNLKMSLIIHPTGLTYTSKGPHIWQLINYIQRQRGSLGLFRGTCAAALRAAVGSCFFFGSLDLLNYLSRPFKDHHSRSFVCSAIARIISNVASNPFNVVQTRLELVNFQGYESIADGIFLIAKNEGWMTLFRGGFTSCLKQGAFAGWYYVIYRAFKKIGIQAMTAGTISGLIATAASHPLQIIRAKLQTEGVRDVKVRGTLQSLWMQLVTDGGMFRGLSPRLVKKPMTNAMTFYLYEAFGPAMKRRRE